MMMKIKNILSLIFCLLLANTIWGQSDLGVRSVFDKYGKQRGTVLVQLSKDVLSEGCNIDLYKSLTIKAYSNVDKEKVLEDLFKNKSTWTPLSESSKNGMLRSATYYIPSKDNSTEYLLIRQSNTKLIIIYLKGDFPQSELDTELSKLKDLFIYVNKKKVKII